MNSRAFAALWIILSVVCMSLLLPINLPGISINPAFSTLASPHQPESGSLEYLCLKYKKDLTIDENDCHEMFSNNNVKTDLGWVFACKMAKIAGNQFPTFVRVPLSFVECHGKPMDQVNNLIAKGKDMWNDIRGLLPFWH